MSDVEKEESVCGMIADSFRGPKAWLTVIAWADVIVLTVLAILCAVKFFRVESMRDLVLYAALFIVLAVGIGLVKMWYWMLLNRNSLARKIDRLEERIARLADRSEQ